MFSLSYLPTAERLTVVLVKARNLKLQSESGDPFVKVGSVMFFITQKPNSEYCLHYDKNIVYHLCHKELFDQSSLHIWPLQLNLSSYGKASLLTLVIKVCY